MAVRRVAGQRLLHVYAETAPAGFERPSRISRTCTSRDRAGAHGCERMTSAPLTPALSPTREREHSA